MFSSCLKNSFFTFVLILLSPYISQAADTFIYDDLNRLERAIYDNGTIIIYSYDEVGNRITKEVNDICEGDINQDGIVNLSDFNLLRVDWLRTDCCDTGTSCQGDINNDCVVNLIDFNMLQGEWLRDDCPIF